ncbi:MAG: dihydrofolate reductase [Oscillospiraceae bacterium]
MDAIVAVYSDWGIGAGGTQPVVLPEDRRRFVELTRGAAVIVGRKTLGDFPGGKPLPKRVNIVITRSELKPEGFLVAHSVQEALKEAEKHDKVFVLGGESVFREFFPHTDRVFVTKINDAPHSDAFFPNLDEDANWHCTDSGEPLMSGPISYRFCVYERIK